MGQRDGSAIKIFIRGFKFGSHPLFSGLTITCNSRYRGSNTLGHPYSGAFPYKHTHMHKNMYDLKNIKNIKWNLVERIRKFLSK